MPDDSKCEGVNCEVREKCWRYVKKASFFRQMYRAFYATESFTPQHGCEHMEPLPPTGTDYFRVKGEV